MAKGNKIGFQTKTSSIINEDDVNEAVAVLTQYPGLKSTALKDTDYRLITVENPARIDKHEKFRCGGGKFAVVHKVQTYANRQ